MVSILEKVEIKDLNITCICRFNDYGNIRDTLANFSYTFLPGRVYGLIGEFGTGGWALSYVLTGNVKSFEGKISINQDLADASYLKRISCYTGADDYSSILSKFNKTVQKQIDMGINNKKSFDVNYNSIIDKFKLTKERVGRPLKYTGEEKWKCSMAIGYANGKLIYCFPWLNSGSIYHLKEHILLCMSILKEAGAIVIIPTTKKETLLNIADEFVNIKGVYDVIHGL